MKRLLKISLSLYLLLPTLAFAFSSQGNTTNDSFSKAKRLMQKEIYVQPEEMHTIYCGAKFDRHKHVVLPSGFEATKYRNRLKTWEAEHVVPAENFGRNFVAWREGNPKCVDKNGKHYKGRKCATKVSEEYRLMQADLYNLFPAIGSVNALRQNYNFTMLPSAESDFGSCDMRIENNKVQPPAKARGVIARTYLYFAEVYPTFNMSSSQRKLMHAWNKQYPVTKAECERAKIIQSIQGNVDPILAGVCS